MDKSTEDLGAERYISRELSWLEFNRRVLHEAADPRTPLLERVNFLAIFTSNLDEFIMKQLGVLKRLGSDAMRQRPGGQSARQRAQAIRKKLVPMMKEQAQIYTDMVLPALAQQGIKITSYKDLNEKEQREAQVFFRKRIFPVLTPLSVDPGHPFPFISNLSESLGVAMKAPKKREKLFARLKLPRTLPQFIRVNGASDGGEYRFVSLMEVIQHHLPELFPGMTLLNVMPFRITRNAEVEVDEEEAEDLLDLVSEELRQRRFERAVRLEHGPKPDPWMLELLMEELKLDKEDVYELPALLDYTSLRELARLPMAPLRYEPWLPVQPKALSDEDADIFSLIRAGDLLIHHPYESFSASVQRFVEAAAYDPNVVAIKLTLYRTGDDNPFIPALIAAAEAGKQVVAIIELKARFDEQRNIALAQKLEKVGVHVVYGLVGLKTHTKTTLVVRNEQAGLRCYAHIGTGNYDQRTAGLYTDLSLLTCRQDLTDDLVHLFLFLTGRSLQREYLKLLVAPVNMREKFLNLIEREIANKQAGKPARIIAKINSLEDHHICEALFRASQAGVPVDLIVRGFCCLRPGVKGLSENIRVISVIGRFLEHSRIFYFAAGGADYQAGEFFIGSADWMYRNLQARVELIIPVEDLRARTRLWEILQIMLNDQRQAWDLQSDGSYVQRQPPATSTGPEAMGTHRVLMDLTKNRLDLEQPPN